MKTTLHFDEQVVRKRPYLTPALCEWVVANPVRREVQRDGRVRFWALVPKIGGRAVRVVTLED